MSTQLPTLDGSCALHTVNFELSMPVQIVTDFKTTTYFLSFELSMPVQIVTDFETTTYFPSFELEESSFFFFWRLNCQSAVLEVVDLKF